MTQTAIAAFLKEWQTDPAGMKAVVEDFLAFLASEKGVVLDFNARPGVSYSLRARHENQKKRSLFAMVDIIDDDPENRWLSVCFYGDMVTDPEDVGDLVPGGLLGEDGYCFDLEDPENAPYIRERLQEACRAASRV